MFNVTIIFTFVTIIQPFLLPQKKSFSRSTNEQRISRAIFHVTLFSCVTYYFPPSLQKSYNATFSHCFRSLLARCVFTSRFFESFIVRNASVSSSSMLSLYLMNIASLRYTSIVFKVLWLILGKIIQHFTREIRQIDDG